MLLQCFAATRKDRFTPGKKSLINQWINGRMSPRVGGTSFLPSSFYTSLIVRAFFLLQILETEEVRFQHPEENWVTHYTQTNEMQIF